MGVDEGVQRRPAHGGAFRVLDELPVRGRRTGSPPLKSQPFVTPTGGFSLCPKGAAVTEPKESTPERVDVNIEGPTAGSDSDAKEPE